MGIPEKGLLAGYDTLRDHFQFGFYFVCSSDNMQITQKFRFGQNLTGNGPSEDVS